MLIYQVVIGYGREQRRTKSIYVIHLHSRPVPFELVPKANKDSRTLMPVQIYKTKSAHALASL
jgi:hypothetical protein